MSDLREQNEQLRAALVIAAQYVNGPIQGIPPPTLEAQITHRRVVNEALGLPAAQPEGAPDDR